MTRRDRIGLCPDCGKERPLSNRGLCYPCGFARKEEARRQMEAKEGPIYDFYLEQWQRARDRVPLPELAGEEKPGDQYP